MSRNRYLGILCIMVFALGLACSAVSNLVPSSSSSNSPAAQDFPLTPNPIAVQVTLDKANAISNKGRAQTGVAAIDQLYKKLADGSDINFQIPDYLFTKDADGLLQPAFGTAVTMTPISAIDGLPFSKGYLKAFQLAPEGLLMISSATLEMTIPGEYKPEELTGFAADGDGSNFHLFPIDSIAGGGTTTIIIHPMHFSLYGVAQATAQEVQAQTSHPPADAGDQDDELLAAPYSKSQTKLSQEHQRLVKPVIDALDQLKGNCNDVAVGALTFETWYNHVANASQQGFFKDQIATDSNVLLERLKDCLKNACVLCLEGKKPDRKSASSFLTLTAFMISIDTITGNTADANLWRALANECAKKTGLPLPSPHVAECTDNCGDQTPTVPACPKP